VDAGLCNLIWVELTTRLADNTLFTLHRSPQNCKGAMGCAHRRLRAPRQPERQHPRRSRSPRAGLDARGRRRLKREDARTLWMVRGQNLGWTRRMTARSRWRRRRSPGTTPASSGTWVPASSCKTPGSAPLPRMRTPGHRHRHHHHHHPLPRLLARSAHRSSTQGLRPPDSDSDDDAEEAFCAETSGAEDEHALGRAGLEGRLVKEDKE
jgi:hypothetical protein